MPMGPDPFDLNRFVTGQAGTYAQALGEIRRGRKTSRWMWFIFPQVADLDRWFGGAPDPATIALLEGV